MVQERPWIRAVTGNDKFVMVCRDSGWLDKCYFPEDFDHSTRKEFAVITFTYPSSNELSGLRQNSNSFHRAFPHEEDTREQHQTKRTLLLSKILDVQSFSTYEKADEVLLSIALTECGKRIKPIAEIPITQVLEFKEE